MNCKPVFDTYRLKLLEGPGNLGDTAFQVVFFLWNILGRGLDG